MLRTGDSELVGKLVDSLDDGDEQVTFIVAQILGSLADTTAVPALGNLVDNPNPDIRARACWSLGSIGHDSALPYLLKGLDDDDGDVRYSAVVALGYLHYPPAVQHIFRMFYDPVDSVRVRAIQSLYYYRLDEGAEVHASDFAPVLSDRSDRVRYVAVQALGGAWEDARGWVFSDSVVAGDLLIESLKDRNKFVRIETIRSLKKLRFKESVPYLKQMYDLASVDEEVAISEAIKVITGEDFPPPLTTGAIAQ
jgi:HEAT repeat protein